jgi:hypothetical protein
VVIIGPVYSQKLDGVDLVRHGGFAGRERRSRPRRAGARSQERACVPRNSGGHPVGEEPPTAGVVRDVRSARLRRLGGGDFVIGNVDFRKSTLPDNKGGLIE